MMFVVKQACRCCARRRRCLRGCAPRDAARSNNGGGDGGRSRSDSRSSQPPHDLPPCLTRNHRGGTPASFGGLVGVGTSPASGPLAAAACTHHLDHPRRPPGQWRKISHFTQAAPRGSTAQTACSSPGLHRGTPRGRCCAFILIFLSPSHAAQGS